MLTARVSIHLYWVVLESQCSARYVDNPKCVVSYPHNQGTCADADFELIWNSDALVQAVFNGSGKSGEMNENEECVCVFGSPPCVLFPVVGQYAMRCKLLSGYYQSGLRVP